MNEGAVLSVGKTLLLPNPTKDPTKKIVTKPTTPAKKPTQNTPQKPAPKPASQPKKDAPNTIKTISYGGYALDLKVEK